jgi:alkanesulfonate monooxygenase SsuD/methylene tetrahydromethanopterin reductase-like flavin-dependent oxidoreductase (luciferase family)
MDEYLQLIISLWCDETPEFHGTYYDLPPCVQLPQPETRPHPPIFIGGESKPALRRVAKFAQGWFAFGMSPEALAERLPLLDDFLAEHGRTRSDVEIAVSPGSEVAPDQAMIDDYGALGVSEVVAMCVGTGLDEFRRNADAIAARIMIG